MGRGRIGPSRDFAASGVWIMIIKNNLNTAVLIPDLLLVLNGNGLLISPLATVVVYNAAAAASAVLATLISSGMLSNIGTQEPLSGSGINVVGIQGAPGPSGPSTFKTFTVNCVDGVINGALSVFSVVGLLATDIVISIAHKTTASSGRNGGQQILTAHGFKNQADDSLTVVFVDVPPTDGTLNIAVYRA